MTTKDEIFDAMVAAIIIIGAGDDGSGNRCLYFIGGDIVTVPPGKLPAGTLEVELAYDSNCVECWELCGTHWRLRREVFLNER